MKANYTHIAIILDRSSSMFDIAADTIGGFNTFLKSQQEAPGDATLTLVQFDTQGIDTVIDAKPVKQANPLTRQSYVPRGGTPLWDAVGQTVVKTGDWLKGLPEPERPEKVVCVIITDGYENSSREYTAEKVRAMVKHQREAYKWEFVFLGADIDSYAVAGAIGIATANVMNTAKNTMGTQALYASTGANLRSYRCSATADMSWTEDDKAVQS